MRAGRRRGRVRGNAPRRTRGGGDNSNREAAARSRSPGRRDNIDGPPIRSRRDQTPGPARDIERNVRARRPQDGATAQEVRVDREAPARAGSAPRPPSVARPPPRGDNAPNSQGARAAAPQSGRSPDRDRGRGGDNRRAPPPPPREGQQGRRDDARGGNRGPSRSPQRAKGKGKNGKGRGRGRGR